MTGGDIGVSVNRVRNEETSKWFLPRQILNFMEPRFVDSHYLKNKWNDERIEPSNSQSLLLLSTGLPAFALYIKPTTFTRSLCPLYSPILFVEACPGAERTVGY